MKFLSSITGECSSPKPEPWPHHQSLEGDFLHGLQLFPVAAVWIWQPFDLGEFISYLYRDKSYWNLTIQGLNWILCLSLCRNFYRKSQQTHWSFVCNFILDVTPLSLVGTASWGRGKSCIQETSGSKCKNAGAIQAYSCTEWYSLVYT